MKRDFLHITDYTTEEIWETLELARWIKDKYYYTNIDRVLDLFTQYVSTTVMIEDAWLNINKPSDLTKLN